MRRHGWFELANWWDEGNPDLSSGELLEYKSPQWSWTKVEPGLGGSFIIWSKEYLHCFPLETPLNKKSHPAVLCQGE